MGEAGEGASLRADAHVEARAHEEDNAEEAHKRGGHIAPQCPVDFALEVHYDGGGEHHGDGEGQEVPVDEAGDAATTISDAWVELAGVKGLVAWPDAVGTDDEEEGPMSTASWEPLGPSHSFPLDVLHTRGWRAWSAAVRVRMSIPMKEETVAAAMVV